MNFENKSTFKYLNKTAGWFTVTIIIALGLKLLHDLSTVEHLSFILWPIGQVLSIALNKPLVLNASGAFIPSLELAIDKSYSGGNFLMVAFCMISWATPHHLFSTARSALLVVHALVLAYLLTIVVVSLRIIVEVMLTNYQMKFSDPLNLVLDISKITIYIIALFGLYQFMKLVYLKLKNIQTNISSNLTKSGTL